MSISNTPSAQLGVCLVLKVIEDGDGSPREWHPATRKALVLEYCRMQCLNGARDYSLYDRTVTAVRKLCTINGIGRHSMGLSHAYHGTQADR
jgi:hypothetical protein